MCVCVCVCVCVGRKDRRLIKILSWNENNWTLFFNIILLAVHTLLWSVLLCLDLIGQIRHELQLWHHDINVSAHFSYIYIYNFISCEKVSILLSIYIYIKRERERGWGGVGRILLNFSSVPWLGLAWRNLTDFCLYFMFFGKDQINLF